MAFPAVGSSAVTSGSTSADPAIVNLPGSIAAGDLLIVGIRLATGATATTPTGWTLLATDNSDASDDRNYVFYRQADGGEGATLSIDLSASNKFAAIAWRITGAEDPATQPPEISTVAVGTSTSPDPNTINPTGGAKDYLWVVFEAWEGEQTEVASGPAGFTKTGWASSGTGGAVATNCQAYGATRQFNSSGLSVLNITISASDDWTAWCIAVHPAGAAGPQDVSPAALERTLTPVAPVVRPDQKVEPAAVALARDQVAPTFMATVGADALALTLDEVAPVVRPDQLVAPAASARSFVPVAPRVDQSVTPAALARTLVPVAPSMQVSVNPELIAIAAAAVAMSRIDQTAHPAALARAIAAVAPRIDLSVSPALLARAIAAVPPTSIDSEVAGQSVAPDPLAITSAAVAPARIDQVVELVAAALAIAEISPAIQVAGAGDQAVTFDDPLAIDIATIAPSLDVEQAVLAEVLAISIAGLEPAAISFPQTVSPAFVALVRSQVAPRVDSLEVRPAALARTIALLSPARMDRSLDLIALALTLNLLPGPASHEITGGQERQIVSGADPWFRRMTGPQGVPIEAWSLYISLISRYGLTEGRHIYERMLIERKGPFQSGAKYDPDANTPRGVPHIEIPKARRD